MLRCAVVLFIMMASIGLAKAQVAGPVPADYFGLTIFHYTTDVPQMSFGMTRSWDAPNLAWALSNTFPGVYDFTALDQFIAFNEAHSSQMIYTLGRTPRWASSQPNNINGDGVGQCAPPRNLADWDNYVRTIVTHAAGRIKYWELWNEASNTNYYCGSISTLVLLAQHAYMIIKSIDPTAMILSPSVNDTWSLPWLTKYMQSGGARYADIINFHDYNGQTAESMIPVVQAFKTFVQTHGLSDKPLWDTESSWATGFTPTLTPEQEAGFIAKYYLLHWSLGVSSLGWYGYDSSLSWGQLWSPTTGLSPGGTAYGQIYNWMVGATMSSACTEDANKIWACTLTRPNGYQAQATWISNSSMSVTVPAIYKQYRDLAGTMHQIVNNTVTIGDQPILLETGPPIITPAYYVSPTGSDANNGLSNSEPFLTLEKAQAAMQASTTIKTTYLLSGTYARTISLTLDANDAGESWLAYPGQTPILEGSNNVNYGIYITGNNITIRWLTIQDYTKSGIMIAGTGATSTVVGTVDGVIIDSNTITNIGLTHADANGDQSGITAGFGSSGTNQITHNRIENVSYSGLAIDLNNTENALITYNFIYNVCTSVANCGGIRAVDTRHRSVGVTIGNNVIDNFGPATNQSQSVGIYLDDQASNFTVSNNIVYGSGTASLEIHGGNNNIINNNIFDISNVEALGFYQYDGISVPNYGMGHNVFTCNIVYSSSAPQSNLWLEQVTGTDAQPLVDYNLYWDTSGTLPNVIPIVDSAPVVANPGFVNAAQNNYTFNNGSPPAFCTNFLPIDASTVGPLPNL